MKKLILATLLISSVLVLCAQSSFALRWPTNNSYRVTSMGGADLGIEDKASAITPFNHQNGAGLLFEEKKNFFEIGAGSTSYSSVVESGGIKNTQSLSGMELTRPNTEYRGLVYWLDDNMLIRAGVEGLTSTMSMKTEGGGVTDEEKVDFSGMGGGASIGYKMDMGLGLSAGLTYNGATGKPGRLTQAFNVMAPYGTTSKLELATSLLDWNVAAVYVIPNLGENGKLNLGLTLQGDDDMPDMSSFSNLSGFNPLSLGDYSGVVTVNGNIPGVGDVTSKMSYTQSPLAICGEAIYSMGTLLSGGILFDSVSSAIQTKEEYTGYPTGYTENVDYKSNEISEFAITPIVKANVPVNSDVSVIGGIGYTTMGSGTYTRYSLNGATAAASDTYKSSVQTTTSGTFLLGAGVQLVQKMIQLGLQYKGTSYSNNYKGYNAAGTTTYDSANAAAGNPKGTISTLGLGGEFWVAPVFAVRAGYIINTQTDEDATMNTSGQVVDLVNTTNSLTLGAGFKSAENLTADLLIKMDTYTRTPEQNPKPTTTGLAVLVDVCIPL